MHNKDLVPQAFLLLVEVYNDLDFADPVAARIKLKKFLDKNAEEIDNVTIAYSNNGGKPGV